MNKILVDMDGVLANFVHTFVTRAMEIHGVNEQDIDRTNFYLQNAVKGVDPSELHSIIDAPDFYESHPPIEGGLEAFESMLQSDEYDPYIVTSPGPFHHAPSAKFRWVRKHLGESTTQRLIITRDKSLVSGHILIDDKPEPKNESRAQWTHVIYDQPVNAHVNHKPRLTWDNWESTLRNVLEDKNKV